MFSQGPQDLTRFGAILGHRSGFAWATVPTGTCKVGPAPMTWVSLMVLNIELAGGRHSEITLCGW
jgi:hypothetical protein